MSKIIFVAHRDNPDPSEVRARIDGALREITPDIIRDGTRYDVRHEDRRWLGTLNLAPDCPRRGLDVCQGSLNEPAEWRRIGSGAPDGSYALIRSDARWIEAVVDSSGMRSLWCYLDDRMFVASNSQRAVTLYAGRFEFDPEVAPWLISTGTLGPDRSYNRYLRSIPPGGVARLDRAAWSLSVEAPEIRFTSDGRSEAEHIDAAEAAIAATLAGLPPAQAETTVISLSGGCDSRLIANLLHKAHPEVAWRSFSSGPAVSVETPGTDTAIAAEVARAFGFRHRFFVNDESDEPIETRLDRFLLCSEGRIDHFKSYAGGMGLFKALFDEGFTEVVRGDQALGGPAIEPNALSARRSLNFLLCREIEGLSGRLAEFGLDGQALPERFERRADEDFVTWRDRLYAQFYCPAVLGALNETKTGFFDVREPLMSARVQAMARALPEPLRREKRIGKILVRRTGPDLPIAKDSGLAKMPDLLRDPAVARLLEASLVSATARACFSPALLAWIGREVALADSTLAKASRAAGAQLRRLSSRGAAGDRLRIGPRRLAFRVHMAVAMVDRLTEDAARFGPLDVSSTVAA